jgi:hypothetical protein
MQVIEKQSAEDTGIVAVSLDKKTLARLTERSKSKGQERMPTRLTERRGAYKATGNGTHRHEPVLSVEAEQPTPFLSLSWEHWLEVREQIIRNLDRFANAAQEQRVDSVLNAGMEMQAALSRIFLEAYVMSAHLGLKELPRRD